MNTVAVFHKVTGKYIAKGREDSAHIRKHTDEGHIAVAGVPVKKPNWPRYDFTTASVVLDADRKQEYLQQKQAKKQRLNRINNATTFLVASVNDPDFTWNDPQELKKVIKALAIIVANGIEEE